MIVPGGRTLIPPPPPKSPCLHVEGMLFPLPFSTFTSDAGIKAVPSCLSAVIAPKQRFLSYRWYRPRTYRLLWIVKWVYGTTSLGTQSRAIFVRTYLSIALNSRFTPATRTYPRWKVTWNWMCRWNCTGILSYFYVYQCDIHYWSN